ncbi:MAG TPA: N-acetylmuramoyl-L-alanine amidase [Flavipsychrobacter sp.]|nr:N-acetylmuramoyl-L-alanine amidase [Flavipsychrobacter sp.]
MTFLLFVLKSSLCSGILLGYYTLLLRNKPLHHFNRYYLLATVLASMFLPLLHFEWQHVSLPAYNEHLFKLLDVTDGGKGEEMIAPAVSGSVSLSRILIGLYGIVSLILLSFVALSVLYVFQLKQKYPVTRFQDYTLIHTPLPQAPFSFFNLLFWREDIDRKSASGKQILRHELTHIRQKHSWDKLLVQVATSIVWLNPFLWLLQKELSLVHEFIADGEALQDNDPDTFAKMLLQTHYSSSFNHMVNPFFHSPIKRRLIMLHPFKQTSYASLRKFMAVPLFALSLLLFSFERKDTGVIKAKQKLLLALDAGHGGKDKGAEGVHGFFEKDLNLKVVNKLAELAADYNIDVVKTRNGDEYPALKDRPAIANSKRADLFLCIHINTTDDKDKSRELPYEMIIDDRNPHYGKSQRLASAISPRLSNQHIQSRLLQKHLVVLGAASMPSVAIEMGNIANEEQVALLTDNQSLERICRSILSGIVDYQNNR